MRFDPEDVECRTQLASRVMALTESYTSLVQIHLRWTPFPRLVCIRSYVTAMGEILQDKSWPSRVIMFEQFKGGVSFPRRTRLT